MARVRSRLAIAVLAVALGVWGEAHSQTYPGFPAASSVNPSDLFLCYQGTAPTGVLRNCTASQISTYTLDNLTSAEVTAALTYTPLNPANNLSEIVNPTTARANLGLSAAAIQSGSVTAGNCVKWAASGQIADQGTLCPVPFATMTAALNAFGAGQTPPPAVSVIARDSNDTQQRGGGVFVYDATIPAPFTITGSIATVPGATTLTVTAATGLIVPGDYITGACVPPGDFVLPLGTNSTTGVAGTGTYALYLPATCSAGALTVTKDNGGTTRIDAAGHGFRYAKNQPVFVDLFGAYQSNAAASNDAPMQYALSDTYYRACGVSGAPVAGASPPSLWFHADGQPGYQVSTPKYVGAPGPNYQCYRTIALHGLGKHFTSVITGVLTSAAPVLDWSGNGNFELDDISIQGEGSATAACFAGRIATQAGGQGTPNTSYIHGSGCWGGTNATGTPPVAFVSQDDDLLFIDADSQFVASGFFAQPTTAGPWGPQMAISFGNNLPYSPLAGAWGIAQGGTTTSITLSSAASSTNGAFVGLPLRVYPGSGSTGACTGTPEPGLITAYNGSTKVATVQVAWGLFTPTSASCYDIYYTASAFQPYAGLSTTSGVTSTRLGGQYQGAIWQTGADTVRFVDGPYSASSGNPAVNVYIDQANECYANSAWTGYFNTEAYGLNSSAFWAKDGSVPIINLDGRLSGTFTDAVFRFNAADLAANPPCLYGKTNFFNDITLKSIDPSSDTLFDMGSNPLGSFVFRGLAQAMGSTGPITYCDMIFPYGPVTNNQCLSGQYQGATILPANGTFGAAPNGNVVGSPNGAVPVASFVPTVTVSTTTGGSSQLRFTYAFPAYAFYSNVLSPDIALRGELVFNNTAAGTNPMVLDVVQGSNTSAIASFTCPASSACVVNFKATGADNWFVQVCATTCGAWGQVFPTSFSRTAAFSLELFEDASTANATLNHSAMFDRVGDVGPD